MTRVKLKEQYISYLSFLQTFNNISVIMLLHTFNIISPILDVRKGDYVIYFPFGFESKIWDLIISVPDHCLSFYYVVFGV